MISRSRELLIGRLRRRKTREREGLYLVEGTRTAATALAADAKVRFACVSPALGADDPLRARLGDRHVEVLEVDDDTLARLADTRTPQGVLLVCEQPCLRWADLGLSAASRVLLLDALQDPGNVGTLVRAAAAFALDAVVALDGTVDPWNPKAVRASAGHVAGVPVLGADWDEARDALVAAPLPVLAATSDGEDVRRRLPEAGWALAIGNEGAGIRRPLLQHAEVRVAIPMPGDVDSLNAGLAGAILMYELSRAGDPR